MKKVIAALAGLAMMGAVNAQEYDHSGECLRTVIYNGDETRLIYGGKWGEVKASVHEVGEEKVTFNISSRFVNSETYEGLQDIVLDDRADWPYHEGLRVYLEETNPVTLCVEGLNHLLSSKNETEDHWNWHTAQYEKAMYNDYGDMTRREGRNGVEYKMFYPDAENPDRIFTIREDLFDSRFADPFTWVRAIPTMDLTHVEYRSKPPLGKFLRKNVVMLNSKTLTSRYFKSAEASYNRRAKGKTSMRRASR